jgi:hypothetical protein
MKRLLDKKKLLEKARDYSHRRATLPTMRETARLGQ